MCDLNLNNCIMNARVIRKNVYNIRYPGYNNRRQKTRINSRLLVICWFRFSAISLVDKMPRWMNKYLCKRIKMLILWRKGTCRQEEPRINSVRFMNTLPFKDEVLAVCKRKQEFWTEDKEHCIATNKWNSKKCIITTAINDLLQTCKKWHVN